MLLHVFTIVFTSLHVLYFSYFDKPQPIATYVCLGRNLAPAYRPQHIATYGDRSLTSRPQPGPVEAT
eukprot:13111042-Heterocapsa_arctica.AAC.1